MWEDSNLEYADDGFSIHELYRGLSPWGGLKKEDIATWEIRSCSPFEEVVLNK
jgi:hypothetical protein